LHLVVKLDNLKLVSKVVTFSKPSETTLEVHYKVAAVKQLSK